MAIVMARSLLEELEAKLTDLDAVIKKADAEKRRKVSKRGPRVLPAAFSGCFFSCFSQLLAVVLQLLFQLSYNFFSASFSSCRFDFSARLFRCPFPLSFSAVFFNCLLAVFLKLFLPTFSLGCLFQLSLSSVFAGIFTGLFRAVFSAVRFRSLCQLSLSAVSFVVSFSCLFSGFHLFLFIIGLV
jgi:hypothetical protein